MKHLLRFVQLLLFCFFFMELEAQELRLKIEPMDSTAQKEIKNRSYPSRFQSVKAIQKEIDKQFDFYKKQGYIDLEATPLKKEKDSLFSTQLKLGSKISIVQFSPTGDVDIPKNLMQKYEIKLNQSVYHIPFIYIPSFMEELNQHLANQGKPFTQLKLVELKKNKDHSLSARLQVSGPEQTRTIDSISIRGYEKFPRAYLKNYLGIKPKQIFNKSKLDKKTDELKNLNFVNVPRNPEILFTKDQTILYLYLEKRNNNRFEGFLGFSTDEETGKFKLDGDINLQLVNNLNYGESLQVRYKNTGNDQQEFDAKLKIPYLFSTPLGVSLNLNLFKQDSSYTTNTQAAKLHYQIWPQLSVEAGYRSTSSTNLLSQGAIVTNFQNESFDARFFSLGLHYENRNPTGSLFPYQTQLLLEGSLGKRNKEEESQPQQSLVFEGEHIFNLDARNSIYIANKTAVLFSDDYLANELYRFGGIHSVRGFEEQSLSASLFSGLQTEYRYLLSPQLYAHSIIDFAYLQNAVIDQKSNLYGIGFGLGLQTKAGLLKIDFANGKADGQGFKFDNTKVHISLTAQF